MQPLYNYDARPERIGAPHLRELLAFWEARRTERSLPLHADLDPIEMREFLPILSVLDVEESPRRYRVRLAGTGINRAFGQDHKGRYFDQMRHLVGATCLFDHVVSTASPGFERVELDVLKPPLKGFEVLAAPLSAEPGGPVRFILGGLEFFDRTGRFLPYATLNRLW